MVERFSFVGISGEAGFFKGYVVRFEVSGSSGVGVVIECNVWDRCVFCGVGISKVRVFFSFWDT